MPATFTIRMHVGSVERVLTVMEAAFDDASELMDDVLLVMIRSTQLNFEVQGRPETWTRLSDATIAARLLASGALRRQRLTRADNEALFADLFDEAGGKKKKSKKIQKLQQKAEQHFENIAEMQILRDTGLLLQSVGGGQSGAFSAEDGFGESDAFTAVIGTNRPGADALQHGFPGGNLPARPYILFQDQDEEDILDMSAHWALRTGPYAVA